VISLTKIHRNFQVLPGAEYNPGAALMSSAGRLTMQARGHDNCRDF